MSPRYEVIRLLGQGGMAGVFLAHDPKLDRSVAIKVISPGLMMDLEMVQRFEHEARTQAKFQHANIVPIFDVGEKGDLHYLAMPHVPGRTLREVMADEGKPLPIPVVKTWLYQVGSALCYAHRRGVVHRDVKPGNILLDADGKAMVTDFGIAKAVDQPGLTRTGMLIGTPAYMSPEQCDTGEVTAASDQYSLGVVAYEMLTGRTPFYGNPLALLKAHLNDPVPPLLELRPDCPEPLAEAIMRMLGKDLADRWPTVDEAVAAAGAVPVPPGHPTHQTLAALSKRVAGFNLPSPRARLEVGHEASLELVAVDAEGEAITGRKIAYDSDQPSTVSVTPDGRLIAHGSGTAQITVRSGDTAEQITIDAVSAGEATAPESEGMPKGRNPAVLEVAGPLTWVEPLPSPEAPDGPGAATVLLDEALAPALDETALASRESETAGETRRAPGEAGTIPERDESLLSPDARPLWKRPLTWVGTAGVAVVGVLLVNLLGGAPDPAASAENGAEAVASSQADEALRGSIEVGPGEDADAPVDSTMVVGADSLTESNDEPAAVDPVEVDEGGQRPSTTREETPVQAAPQQSANAQEANRGGETDTAARLDEDESDQPPAVQLPPLAEATLAIIGDLPDDAEVIVSGDSMTPRTVEGRIVKLPPGRYRLVATAPGYTPSSVNLELDEYSTETWDPELTPVGGASTATIEDIQIAIDGFISAFRARRVDRVVALLPADTRDRYRAFMGMDVSRWDVTSGFEDIQEPVITGNRAIVDFAFTLRTRDVNSGDQTQQMSFQAELVNEAGRWQLRSVQPR